MNQSRGAIGKSDRLLAAAIFAVTLLACALPYWMQVKAVGRHFWSVPSGLMLRDFGFLWGGARLFWLGKTDTIFHPALFNDWLAHQIAPGSMEMFATWSYPPTMLLPLLPFGLLPPSAAMALWIAATFSLLTWVLHRLLHSWWIVAAVVLSPAACYCFVSGQNGALTAALFIAGLWITDRRPIMAGICFGLLTIKPHLGILVPFALAAGGHWRAFASAAITACGVFALTVLLFGADAWSGFLHNTMPHMSAQLLHDYGIPPQHAMPTMLVTLQGWGVPTARACFAQTLSTLAAIVAVIWAWRQPNDGREWRNAVTCTALLLATPFGYTYDMIPAMLAVVLLVKAGIRGGFAWPERPILIAVWMWPAIAVTWTYGFALPPIGGFALGALLGCLLARRAQRPQAEQAAVASAAATRPG